MKNLIFVTLLLLGYNSFAQKLQEETFISGNDTISYKAIKSTYNAGYIYINMYEQNEDLTSTALKCINTINHSSFYFVEIPKKYTQEQRELILNDLIIKVIKKKEKIKMASFYFNFDTNYSTYYIENKSKKKPSNKIIKITTDITAGNICQFLMQ
jgi:hypothetical protein